MRLMYAVGAAAVLSAASIANAQFGGMLTYAGGPVNVEFLGETAGLDSELYYYPDFPLLTNAQFLFHNHLNTPGDMASVNVPLGTPNGAELVFGIVILDGSGDIFFSGPGTRNADGVAHNLLTPVDPALNIYDCGFEDLVGGGDLDYDDNVFRFNGAVPAPATLPMIALGAFAATRRKRRSV